MIISSINRLLILTIAVFNLESTRGYPPLTDSLLGYVFKGIRQTSKEPPDTKTIKKEYDFIIVGAGSSGCVVANRLSEIKGWNILLIEAGIEENFLMDIPLAANLLQFSPVNWNYKTITSNNYCLGMVNNQCHIPRGKVMGGSSVLNYMIYGRGHKQDWDDWEKSGNPGWGYSDVMYYFLKSEDNRIPDIMYDEMYHHRGGYLTISNVPYKTPLAKAFVNSGVEMGYDNIDYNADQQVGFSFHQVTMQNGTRYSTSRAFLHPINKRSNLNVIKRSQVTKVLIDPVTKLAYGVEYKRNQKTFTVYAKKEVILSAGAINSPQILMLSGVGPSEHLTEVGIEAIQDLPVGYNLQDHVALGGLMYSVNESVPLSSEDIINDANKINAYFRYHDDVLSIPGGTEAISYFNTKNNKKKNNNKECPDLELLFISGTLSNEPTLQLNFNIKSHVYKGLLKGYEGGKGYMIFPMVSKPKSTGRIKLASKNSTDYPLIDMGYFSDPSDLDILVKGVRISNKLAKMKSFQKYNAQLYRNPIPGCTHLKFNSDEYWKCHAKQLSFTIYHQCGTCKMGPASDKSSVVDPRLKVIGIKGLRVIDASIIPKIPIAHTNGPTIMIGEKGSDMIKEDWGINVNKILKTGSMFT